MVDEFDRERKELMKKKGHCAKCGDEIELTDVEGHYSGVCKECKEMNLKERIRYESTVNKPSRVNRRMTSTSPRMGEYSQYNFSFKQQYTNSKS